MRIWVRVVMASMATTGLQAGDLLEQFWPEAKVYIKTAPTSRIYLQWAATREKEEAFTDGQLGAHMDFYFSPLIKPREQRHPDAARNKMLMIRAGYYYGKTPPDSKDPFTEHTALLEVTPRVFLPKLVLLEARFRGDFRFVDGKFQPRFRNRWRVERTFKMTRTSLTPYAEYEPFYDWRYHAFHRQRYSVGMEWALSKRFVLEGYYLRQQDSEAAVQGLDVAGVVLQFYFR